MPEPLSNEEREALAAALAEAHRSTAELATTSMQVNRNGWTDDDWIADAERLMDHIDGSVACLLNGHVFALQQRVSQLAARVAATEQRVREEVAAWLEGDEAREVVTKALTDEGAAPGSSLHSWRCEYPDGYGPCACVTETAAVVVAALAEQLRGPR